MKKKSSLIWIIVALLCVAVAVLLIVEFYPRVKPICGDGVCDSNENRGQEFQCRADCGRRAEGNNTNNGQSLKDMDISYGGNKLQKLDVYYKENFKDAPIVVVVHGGGWRSGDKNTFSDIAEFFSSEDYVVMTPNYRLVPEATFPTQIEDVACSIAWMQENAAKYGGNPNEIIVYGHSAGAQIGALIVYDEGRDWTKNCDYKLENNFVGFIGSSGPYDFDLWGNRVQNQATEFLNGAWDEAEPINFISSNDPPGLFIDGTKDELVPYQNANEMATALESKGVSSESKIYDGYTHNQFNNELARNADLQKVVTDFLGKIE